MVQSACCYALAFSFYRTTKIIGFVKIAIFGHFGQFGLKIRPLWLGNRNKNPWDYKTRAQELTSGAIRMFLSSFVEIWEHFKDEGQGDKIAASISVAILTFFTNFSISRLWIDESAWNWWSNWRVFAALADGKKFFDRFCPQFF